MFYKPWERYKRFTNASENTHRFYIICVAIVAVMFSAFLIQRSWVNNSLIDEGQERAMERCLAEHNKGLCETYARDHGKECSRGMVKHPGKYDKAPPRFKDEEYYSCLILGLDGYRAKRRGAKALEEQADKIPSSGYVD